MSRCALSRSPGAEWPVGGCRPTRVLADLRPKAGFRRGCRSGPRRARTSSWIDLTLAALHPGVVRSRHRGGDGRSAQAAGKPGGPAVASRSWAGADANLIGAAGRAITRPPLGGPSRAVPGHIAEPGATGERTPISTRSMAISDGPVMIVDNSRGGNNLPTNASRHLPNDPRPDRDGHHG